MNYLALLQMIRPGYDWRDRNGRAIRERDICAAIVACARKSGFSDDDIHGALNSDRCFTIYEP